VSSTTVGVTRVPPTEREEMDVRLVPVSVTFGPPASAPTLGDTDVIDGGDT
jgi:hypothetical protein